jgi:hypothetical protein
VRAESRAVPVRNVGCCHSKSFALLGKPAVPPYTANPFSQRFAAIWFARWIPLGVASVTRGGFASGSSFLWGAPGAVRSCLRRGVTIAWSSSSRSESPRPDHADDELASAGQLFGPPPDQRRGDQRPHAPPAIDPNTIPPNSVRAQFDYRPPQRTDVRPRRGRLCLGRTTRPPCGASLRRP